MKDIEKACAISDAKIQFVSLVDKAANKKQFLITKAKQSGGVAMFQSFGRILKADNESHFVTGIVYEPMAEDTDGNYMTAEEIEKAAHWFMKHGGDVDIQHCFQKAKDVEVVESFVAKSDMEMEGQKVTKGTWIMTMEVADASIWDSITKGEITGFSMGGVGNFSQKDEPLDQIQKNAGSKGLFRRLAKSFGMDVVEKGEVKEDYRQRVKSDNFWTAHYALENALRREVYMPGVGYRYVYTENEDKIRDALTDFNEIIMDLLSSDDLAGELEKSAKEAEKIEKAGKSLSSKNLAALQTIATSLFDFLAGFTELDTEDSEKIANSNGIGKSESKNINREDAEMTQEVMKALVEDAVKKAVAPIADQFEEIAKAEGEAGKIGEKLKDEKKEKKEEEEIEKIVEDAVKKAMGPIQEQIETIRKSRLLPNNLNDEPVNGGLKKSEQHYLHGIL